MELTYVLPLKARGYCPELAAYLDVLAATVEQVVVVDASPPAVFAEHARRWPAVIEHVRVDADLHRRNRKVSGVLTGLRRARHELVVLADDDVRYRPEQLARVAGLLERADAVLPQNYFAPLPWHARWDTARTLINRAIGHDYPGTLGVRRDLLAATGGYDGDVLFENLELLRTVRAAGGRVTVERDLLVRRVPPSTRQFLGQRLRQAYDSLAQPPRLLLELAVMPLTATLCRRSRVGALSLAAGAAVAVAEGGRRRGEGTRVYPVTASLCAPLWVLERGLCAWLAVACRLLLGGVPYPGMGRLRRAATPNRILRRTLAHRSGTAGRRRHDEFRAPR
jgi:hypothetical protein